MYSSGPIHKGFRYKNPNVKHFCLLKSAQAASNMNASIVLAMNGFSQQVCMLIRITIECLTYVDFAIAGIEDGVLGEKQKKVIDHFFIDINRNNPSDFKIFRDSCRSYFYKFYV